MNEPLLEIGKIVAAQGLNGEVRVYPFSDFPDRFLKPGPRWLQRPNQTPQPVTLKSGRSLDGKGLFVLKLDGIHTREAAEALRNAILFVSAADRPELEDGEFYVPDLIGLTVFDQATQIAVGTVISVIPAGHDILEVQRETGKCVLIPFVEAIVPIVDLAQGRIEITPPLGLIED